MTTLVLLHAFPLDASMYDPLKTALKSAAPTLRVVCPQLPGFGGRPLADGAPDLRLLADAVAGDIRSHQDTPHAEPVVVGGTSMGGYVALALLRDFPELVDALVLIDTKASADEPHSASARLDMAARLEAEATTDVLDEQVLPRLLGATTWRHRPDVAAAVGDAVQRVDPRAAAWAQRAMAARPDTFEVLRRRALPVLVVVGDEDEITPEPEARRMVDAAHAASLRVMKDAGHLTPLEAPEQVASVLAAFTSSLG